MCADCIPRILLVDSELQWKRDAAETLEREGKYEVEEASDITTALKSSFGDGFDLIMINAMLALGKEEAEFQQIVRKYGDRVLVISDVRSITTAIRVFKMGADYAEKPFEPRRVMDLVSTRLQKDC